MTDDPNPGPDDERGEKFDPSFLSINSTRGRALDAVIDYAWWLRRCTDAQRKAEGLPPISFEAMPEVREVLDAHLDVEKEPTLTIRSVYGRHLKSLAGRDWDWLRASVTRMLPEGQDDHSPRNGAMDNHSTCRPGTRSITHYLQALGYRTVLANKLHVNPSEVFGFEYVKATLPPVAGRKRYYRDEGLDTAVIDRLLAEHARTRPRQPLCLILGENGPHVVWEQNRIYDPDRLPLPPIAVDTPMTRAAMANYYQDITSTDRRLGAVLESLRRHRFEDNTLFLYTSDHGPEWPRSKWTLYDAGLRVPFVARWPGRIPAGATTGAMISFVDVLPTVIDVAGGKPPAGLDGRSFRQVLEGRADAFRTEIYATHSRDKDKNVCPQRAVRDLRYKYILNLHPERKWTTHFTLVPDIPGSHKQVYDTWTARARTDPATARLMELIERHPAEELYDTQTDPHELRNLAGDAAAADVLARMRERLRSERARLGDVDE